MHDYTTLAVLSWGARDTLKNTLESYRKYELDYWVDERIIWFQELSPLDKVIANEYGYTAYGSNENIGIAGGYKELVAKATGSLFLFLENDWELIQSPVSQILSGLRLLSKREVDLVRYRHRRNPGNPLWTRQFLGREYDRPTHLLDAVHYRDDNELKMFPELRQVRDFWTTTSKNANWTNNPHMARTSFLQQHIVPRLEGDIERSLQDWWAQQDFLVAQGEGLFTHNRIG